MIRSTLLFGYSDLTRSLGADPERLLRRSGIDPRVEREPDGYIPYSALSDLLARTADETGCDSFGLRLSAAQGLNSLGPLGFAMQNCANLGEALAEWRQFQSVHMHGAHGELHQSKDIANWTYYVDEPGLLGTQQKVAQAIGLACNILRGLLGPSWRPHSIRLAQSPPSLPGEFRQILGARVFFNAESDCVTFASNVLEHPIERSNPELRKLIERLLTEMKSDREKDRVDQVRRAIRSCLSRQDCSIVEVAAMLSVAPRTLQRHLSTRGLSFSRLLEEVRSETATRHMTISRLSLTQLAAILGYSELSAFSRAFRRWHGQSPQQWLRSRHHPGDPGPVPGLAGRH